MAEQRSTLIIEISSEQAARNARALDRELQSIERTGNYATTSMNSMSVATRQLAGYLAGVVTVGTAIAKMDTYTGLNNKLKLVTKSQSELNTAMNDTFKIAQNTAQAWDSVAQIYQRFSDNAQRLNITQAKTAELTDTVAKAIAISGGSAASAEAALVQFSQALASNVLRGEELNSVMEQAPGLAKAIAQGMGITVGQLRSVAAEGKITGDVLVDALTKARGSVNELFGKTDFTIAQSFTQLSNEVTKFVGEAGKGSGAAKVLSSSISALAENLAPIANAGAALAIGMLTKAMISNAAATTSATYSLIAKVDASIAERNANIAAAQAEVASAAAEAQSTQVTLTNIKATHAQIMAEIELEKVRLKAQITDQGRMATTTRMAQLGRLQAQVALEVAAAESAQTASSARLSAALTAQTVATSRLALAKSALMAIFSPMGLAIAATAATFYLLSSSSDEVKESLATQADSVESLTKKYLELNTVQALVEGVRLRKEIEQQNDVIDDASSATKRFAYIQKELFKLSGNDYADYQKAVTSIAKGASDAGDLLNKMIASGRFSQNQIDKLVEFSGAVAESKNKIEQNNNALKLLNATSGQHVEVTADSIKQLTIQTNLTKVATQNFTDMKTQMLDSLQAQVEFIRLNGGSEEQVNSLNKVIQAYSLNQLTATDAVKKFNSSAKVPSDVIKGLIDYASKTDQSKFAMNQANTELKAIQENGSKAKQGFIDASQGASTAMSEVDKLNEKMKEFNKTIAQRKFDAGYQQILITQYGKTPEQAAEMLKIRKDAEKIGLKNPTADMLKNGLSVLSIENKLKGTIEAKSKAEKDRTKELERQLKVLQINEKVMANAAKYNFGGLEGKYGLPSGMLSAIHMIESRGNANAYNKGSGAAGGFQFLKSTGDQYGVKDRYNLAQSAEGAAKYISYLLKLFNGNVEKAVRAYHAGEGNVQKGKNLGKYNNQYIKDYYGYMGGISGFTGESKDYESLLNDQVKLLEKSQEEAEKIRKEFMSKGLQEEQEYKEQLKKIRENLTLSGDEKKTYEAQLTTRFEAQKKLNDLQQDYELNSYKYTESQKLQYTHDTNILRIDADSKYSDFQKALAKKAIDDQLAYELEKSKLAKDQRLLQSTEFYMSELQLVKAKYDIERRLLVESNDHPEEKAFKTQMLELQNQVDMNRRLKDASIGWDSVQSQMNGSTGRFQVSQDRFSRMGVSQNLFDTQIADVERQEQEPGADLQKLAEVREQIWAAHNKRMIDIENQYQTDSLNLQLTQAQQLTGSFANMFKGILGESSGAYKTMFAMQQGFALTQAGMNLWSSVSDAYAKEPGTVWQKVAAGAKAALDQGTFLAMIQAITPQGFATGGHITGKGTGTSDDIPIMASNGEFMMRQYAASKIGLVALNYMNQTGEIPFQREYLGMKSHYLGSTQPDLNVQKFKDGGLVGVSRINNADVERSQFDSIRQRNAGTNVPTINIYNSVSNKVEATASWDGKELTVIIEEIKKQNRAETQAMINKSWKMATSQGGVIDNLKRGR
ncbi:tape measure protein [Acinetobacter guillouiae]|uniref:tape measure protein n=1 Tax=Acinetobacter guillouiae TaxID=106649 RepID=UPI003AF5918C